VIRAVRSEWIKLRTARTNVVLVLGAIAFGLIVTTLTAALSNIDRFETVNLVTAVTAPAILMGLLLGTLGALCITSEYGHGTIRPTFAATPKRVRVFSAKGLVLLAVSIVGGGAVIAANLAIGWAIVTGRGASVDLSSDSRNMDALVGCVLLMAILTFLGYALGLLTHSSPFSITILFAWPLLLEQIIGGILFAAGLETAIEWLPYQRGFLLAIPDPGEDAPNRWWGGAYFAAVVLVMLVVGALANRRRDA
jgi:ABC-2 type transport system permease protein